MFVMKIGIRNNDLIICSGLEQAPKDRNVELESLERGKRETLNKTPVSGVLVIRFVKSKFLNSRESRGVVLMKP